MEVRKATPDDLPIIEAFYQERLPGYQISHSDIFFGVFTDNKVAGIVRLVNEFNCLMLRGMQIADPYQRQGLGTQLLFLLDKEIGKKECFCIPYTHLINFYNQIGFVEIPDSNAPEFLRSRVNEYRKKAQNIIMLRSSRSLI